MKELNQYILEKFKISKDIDSSNIDDIDIDFISYHNGVKAGDSWQDRAWRDNNIEQYIKCLKKLSEDFTLEKKIKKIKRIVIKYWLEDNGAVASSVKYLITFFLPGKEISEQVIWDAPGGTYKLVEGPKELGNIPDECKLIKYMISELI